jgi:hypothetical protein
VLVLIVFWGIKIGFQKAGVWSTSGKVNSTGELVQPSSGEVNAIKGLMTFDQVSTTFNIPLAFTVFIQLGIDLFEGGCIIQTMFVL